MISFRERAWQDYLYWQETDKKNLKRINALIKDIQRNPFKGIGKPEPLKHHKLVFGHAVLIMSIDWFIRLLMMN